MPDRVLVTGGCGFIGANLVPALVADGFEVRVLDNLATGCEDYLDPASVDIVAGDVRDADAVDRALSGVGHVVHLAAAGSVVDSVTDPVANFENNVLGTFTVLDRARRAGVHRLVFSSTGGALIGNAEPPVDERSLPKPISPYGASKLAAEAYCHAFAKSYGLGTVATRFANVYGPWSGHKRGAVTAFFRALHENRPLSIYGDGTASRDFLHVDDICRGLQLCLRTDVEPGTVVHLATGVETTVTELARSCARAAGKPDHPLEYLPRRAGEVERNFAAYDKARDLLGFAPTVTLESGLADTWRWFGEHVFGAAAR